MLEQRVSNELKSRLWRAMQLTLLIYGVWSGLRALHDVTFPNYLWLGRLAFTMPIAIVSALCVLWLLRQTIRKTEPLLLVIVLLPLLTNAFDSQPMLTFLTSGWLVAVLAFGVFRPRSSSLTWFGLTLAFIVPLFLFTLQRDFGTADTFEFQVTAPQMGIAHPTGYPLYLTLGKLWTLPPIGTAAARLNFGTMVYMILAAVIIQRIMMRVLRQPVVAVLTAVTFVTLPTVWGQSIAAEVYSLHALIIAGILYVVLRGLILDQQFRERRRSVKFPRAIFQFPWVIGGLSFLLGLGLTNHLTTVLVLPTLLLFGIFVRKTIRRLAAIPDRDRAPVFWIVVFSFGLPLLFYSYLPIRWFAVNGEAMGAQRFIEWVTGSRFAGALRWESFITEPERYLIVGRLFLQEWTWFGLLIIVGGIVALFVWRWRYGLLLFVAWQAFTFYALNYHVPDLNVFLIPAHLVLALFWGTAGAWFGRNLSDQRTFNAIILLILGGFTLLNVTRTFHTLPTPASNPLREYGEGVLALDLEPNAVILADSDKFPPLYYLQQAENLRPDLNIKLLPDEAAYRAELDQQLSAGNTVYLARYLPRLPYAMRSVGPLIEVEPPVVAASRPILSIGDIDLIRAKIDALSPYDSSQAAVTLEWLTEQPLNEALLVYLRWQGDAGIMPPTAGQHPVNNFYPTNAWRPKTTIADFHQIPRPILPIETTFNLEVALAPAFTPAQQLEWSPVGAVTFPATRHAPAATRLNIHIGDQMLTGLTVDQTIRPNSPIPITLTGIGDAPAGLRLGLRSRTAATSDLTLADTVQLPAAAPSDGRAPFAWQTELTAPAVNGEYDLIAFYPGKTGRCETLNDQFLACGLGRIAVAGTAIPATATNFNDQFALLNVDLPSNQLTPGGTFDLTLNWQALAATDINYTVFVQLLDQNDNLITQIDSAPLQGTFPTSQWQPDAQIADSYKLTIPADLPSGAYKLHIGLYNLRDLRRLPVLNSAGNTIDDKHVVSGIVNGQ